MKRWLTWPKLLAAGLLLLLLAAWYVPRLSADRYREPIRAGLQNALGRKVEIGEVKFQLLPVPGFTVRYVQIGEDPAIGAEPIAYIDTLRGRPRLSALFGGPLEFASVDLEDTSVNLSRVDSDAGAVRWNFTSLLRPKLLTAFPSIHLIGGRVNFKIGDTKSVFYLLNTDVDLWPPSGADAPWTLRVHSWPARTDRPSHGFGSFQARGEWRPGNGPGGGLVTLDVKLEKSELGDIVTLFQGRESYLQGHIWGDAHLAGPVSRVGLAGRLRIDDIHGWNQTPPGGGALPVSLGGAIDIPGQIVEIRATTEGKQPPVDVRYRLSSYLTHPRWGVTALFSQLPLAPLPAVARNLGFDLPADLSFDGIGQGAVGLSMPEGRAQMDGQVQITGSTLSVAGTPPLHVSDAELKFAGSTVTLSPASITNESKESALVSGVFDVADRSLQVTLSSEGMALASLRRQVSIAHVPLLSLATSGSWSGDLRYSNTGLAGWSGDLRLKDAEIPFEAFSQPVRLLAADLSISGASVLTKRLSFSLGGIEGQGDYRYEADSPRPHRFHVNLGKVDAAAVEKLLMPALHRGSFLNYAFNFGRVPEPDWLRNMHADGTVQIASLDFNGTPLTKLKFRVLWDDNQARLTGLQAFLQDAAFAGAGTVNVAQRQPRYDFTGRISGFPWHSGNLEAEGTLTTLGTGPDLLANMKAEGKLRGRNIEIAPLDPWDRIDGTFDWAWSDKTPRLKLGQLVMTSGSDTYQGSAETRADGQIVLHATDGTKQIQTTVLP